MEHQGQGLTGPSTGPTEAPRDAGSPSPQTQRRGHTPPYRGESEDPAPVLADQASATFQQQWEEIQTHFVDDPRAAVEDADRLVATVMQQLAEGFAHERSRLEAQWDRGENISTENLRVALTRYRSFFARLLTAR